MRLDEVAKHLACPRPGCRHVGVRLALIKKRGYKRVCWGDAMSSDTTTSRQSPRVPGTENKITLVKMRYILETSFLIGLFYIFITPTFADENSTCTQRRDVCFAYCEKSEDNSPQCRNACDKLHSECMSTGCWESKVAAKRCGFIQQ